MWTFLLYKLITVIPLECSSKCSLAKTENYIQLLYDQKIDFSLSNFIVLDVFKITIITVRFIQKLYIYNIIKFYICPKNMFTLFNSK